MNEKEATGVYSDRESPAGTGVIASLIADLASEDGITRVRARRALADIGHTAVGPLVEALTSKKEWVRWEAAKTLAQIGDPAATRTLIDALSNSEFEIRWLAAEGLIHIGDRAIRPLLKELIGNSDSLFIREGAHHILRDLPETRYREILTPVLHALEDVEPSLEVAVAAKAALNAINKGN
jgi:HEAT repeat protein